MEFTSGIDSPLLVRNSHGVDLFIHLWCGSLAIFSFFVPLLYSVPDRGEWGASTRYAGVVQQAR